VLRQARHWALLLTRVSFVFSCLQLADLTLSLRLSSKTGLLRHFGTLEVGKNFFHLYLPLFAFSYL
jgi:hypothetical protein